jgi:hypothetical protein
MSNVYISLQAVEDLNKIFTGLINWKKGALEIDHALQYVNDIEKQCYSIGHKTYHSKVKHPTHKLFGDKVFVYRRNPGTDWFIVYNIDQANNIFITKIISNYLTID